MHNQLVDAITELRDVVDDVELAAEAAPSWDDVTDKPSTFAPASHTHNASDIDAGTLAIARIPTGTTSSTVALGDHSHEWDDIANKPSTFAPGAHTHEAADIEDATATGLSLLTAADAATARSAIGAGTSTISLVSSGGNNGSAGTAARSDHTHDGLMESSAPSIADSEASDASELVADFNALLAALRTRGVLASE